MPNISQPSVRRTLFHQTLSRRPASTGPPNSLTTTNPSSSIPTAPSIGIQPSNNNTTNTLSTRSSHHRLKPTSSSETSRPIKPTENREIVVRDKNGGYKLDVPSLPHALVGEDGEELGGLEAEEEGGEAGLDVELNGRDKESMFDILAGGLGWEFADGVAA